MIPPAAISGTPVTRATWVTRASSAVPLAAGPWLPNVPRCAPASAPWMHRQVAPAAVASRASVGLVTVTTVADPARRKALSTPGSGQPNVKLTAGGGSASSASSFSAHLSSSQAGSATTAPTRVASSRSELTYRAVAAGSVAGGPGDEQIDTEGPGG